MTDLQRDQQISPPSQAAPVLLGGAAAHKRSSPAGRSLATRVLPPIGVFIAFVGFWYLYAGVVLDENGRKTALPYPHKVVTSFYDGKIGEQPGDLIEATRVSAVVALAGLAIAIVIGVTVAVLMSQAKWIEDSLYPYAVFLQTVPVLALVPLIGLLIGFGFPARILVCVIISLFPIITNTLFGLKSAEKGLHELFTLHNQSRFTRLIKLQLPASLPAMFTGFQISAGLSVIGAIVGGFFFQRGPRDLGNRIQLYSARLSPGELVAAIFLSAMLGVVFFQFFGWLGQRLTRNWHQPA